MEAERRGPGAVHVEEWTKVRIPFVVWDADAEWPNAGSGGSAISVNGFVTSVQIHREHVRITSTDQAELLHSFAVAHLAGFLDSPQGDWIERHSSLIPPLADARWQRVMIDFGSELLQAKEFVVDGEGVTIAVATYRGGHVVIGCMGCDVPRLIPATLGTIVDRLPE